MTVSYAVFHYIGFYFVPCFGIAIIIEQKYNSYHRRKHRRKGDKGKKYRGDFCP